MRVPQFDKVILAVALAAVTATPAGAVSAGVVHGTGARFDATAPARHDALTVRSTPRTLPATASLESFAVPPGDQGQVNACVSWAVAHTAIGLLGREQKISGGPNAAMYIYSQIARGANIATSPDDNLAIAKSQGADTETHYSHASTDYTSQPTAADRANAKHYRISGYTTLRTGSGLRQDVQRSIASGLPVMFLFPTYQSFHDLRGAAARDYSYRVANNDTRRGDHEVVIIGYNDKGVRVENSWSAKWGDGGFANLSWSYLTSAAYDAQAIGKLVR